MALEFDKLMDQIEPIDPALAEAGRRFEYIMAVALAYANKVKAEGVTFGPDEVFACYDRLVEQVMMYEEGVGELEE